MSTDTDPATKPVDVPISTPEAPSSLREQADKMKQSIEGGTEEFSDLFEKAGVVKKAVDSKIDTVQRIEKQGFGLFAKIQGLLGKQIGDEKAQSVVSPERERQQRELFTNHFQVVRDAHDSVLQKLIKQGAERKSGLTPNEFFRDAASILSESPMWATLLSTKDLQFEENVKKIISGEMKPEEIDAYEKRVVTAVKTENAEHEINIIFACLRALNQKNMPIIPLSERSVPGMMGRVLSQADAEKVFNGDVKVIQALPDGEVELMLSDATHSFYHRKDQADIPESVTKRLNEQNAATKIQFVRYHPETDIVALFDDMSEGQRVTGTVRETGETLVVEGITNSSKVVFVQAPATWDDTKKDAFMKTPLAFMNPVFTYSGSTPTVIAPKEKPEDKK